MLTDRVSNPGPLTYESGALPIALRGPVSSRIRISKQELERVTYHRRNNNGGEILRSTYSYSANA